LKQGSRVARTPRRGASIYGRDLDVTESGSAVSRFFTTVLR
jgi:hypothetical protein